jgi:hypothetical protein
VANDWESGEHAMQFTPYASKCSSLTTTTAPAVAQAWRLAHQKNSQFLLKIAAVIFSIEIWHLVCSFRRSSHHLRLM